MGIEYGLGRSEISQAILAKRYLQEGEIPEDLINRVAKTIAMPEGDDRERYANLFAGMMSSGEFLPNSPCLANAGTGRNGGLFACFVLGMDDSLESISKAKADAMAITKYGGGWGISLSNLRPAGSRVGGSTHGFAGGPIGFLETFSSDMRTMTQGGFRDAACMATIRVDHPDIYEFLRAKSPANSLSRLLNIDTRFHGEEYYNVLDMLMGVPALQVLAETHLSNFNMSVTITDEFMRSALSGGGTIKLKHPVIGGEFNNVNVRADGILEEIAEGMWLNGEPGILFIDRIRQRTRYNPEEIHATNPCGEQALPPYGSCCLGSINVAAFVRDGVMDWARFKEAVYLGIRFLDNMISMNDYPTEEIRQWSLDNRAVGLGIMGYADALIMMDMRYGEKNSLDFARELAYNMRKFAEEASVLLGEQKGSGKWDGRRNRALLSIAPTGTISLLAGCSPGIEPIFRNKIIREDQTGKYELRHPLSEMDAFVSVDQVDPESLISMVGAFSEHIDNSVSYTVNVLNTATVGQIIKLIIHAWRSGCNGITVYRDGSRQRQVLNEIDMRPGAMAEERPHRLSGTTLKYKAMVNKETTNVYATVNYMNDTPWELFLHTPWTKDMQELQLISLATRLISICLRYNVPIGVLLKQLGKVEGQALFSIPAIISKALRDATGTEYGTCPECGEEVYIVGGCETCQSCGYSRCG